MVKPLARRSFRDDESGISLTEGMIVLPIVLLAFAAFVEFGYAMFQWNQTVKATQLGARFLAVSDPLIDLDPIAPAPAAEDIGQTTPNDGASVSCTGGACDANGGMTRLVEGNDTWWPGLNFFNDRIGANNVVVTYQRSGLGYWGRANGPVVTIRVEVQNITFDLPIIGALLGITDLTTPAMPVTVTSEDLSTSN